MTSATASPDRTLRRELEKCQRDPVRFNETILGRDQGDGLGNYGYWPRQAEIARSVVDYPVTLVQTGNMVGKSFVDAGLLMWFLIAHPGCLVLATAPTQVQLEEVLWKEVERAYHGSRVPLGGRLLQSPLKVDLGGGWQALAYSTTKTERFAGHHESEMLAILDEASGVSPEVFSAVSSCNPSRTLMTGNPLQPSGEYYDRCTSAHRNRLANLIKISSLESPHIHLERSPWGLADATWLAMSRNDYGEGSAWWQSHVLGEFPDAAEDSVVPRHWLDRAADAGEQPWRRNGPPRLAIDLAEGGGGDRTVLLVRDDNGVLALEHGNTWTLEAAASRAALLVQQWGIEHWRVSWDVAGIGADFANRLESVGIRGARPYRGGEEAGIKFANRRAAGAWRLRQRLDPGRRAVLDSGATIPQPAFAIRPEWMRLMREELQGLRYHLVGKERVELERKEDFAKRLRHSPDFADCLGQSFYWGD